MKQKFVTFLLSETEQSLLIDAEAITAVQETNKGAAVFVGEKSWIVVHTVEQVIEQIKIVQ
jgi:hypothetical protein